MGKRAPSVFTIPAGVPFARTLARGIVERFGTDPLALADVLIFVPTRRAARSLHQEFALALGGAALGPRIRALGDAGDEDIAFDPSTDDIALRPAVPPLRRQLLLARLVEAWGEARGLPLPFVQAVSHAGELARFLDEATTHGADLSKLKDLAPAELAGHWQAVLGFLNIIGETWPLQLEAEGAIEPAARRDLILRALAGRLVERPPTSPIIAAGSTGSIPATAELLETIARLPAGMVVLPALDTALDQESWADLDPSHAQYGLKQLLQHFAMAREDVEPWPAQPANAARVRFLSEALRPPPTTDRWRALIEQSGAFSGALDGLSLIEAATPREEALAIAVAMREALETAGRTAALVTPDRGLARRVTAELARWNIDIDDSGGLLLSRTPTGAFLALLARAAAEEFAPVPLLALLKHPFAAGGRTRSEFLRHVRELEIKVLRGLRPAAGLEGIAGALEIKQAPQALVRWFGRLMDALLPFADAMRGENIPLHDLVRAHAGAAEWLSETDERNGSDVLWKGEAGAAAATLIDELAEQGSDIVLSEAYHYAELFRDLAEARVARPAYGKHPRLAILGPLEARLLHFDLTILGGLNEGTWPAEASTDPWLSRQMRAELGLEAPERRIGLAAHDFATLAAAPDVLLTRSLKEQGAPTNASRWLLRVKQLAKGLGLEAALGARNHILAWAREIDRTPLVPRIRRPEPRPPVAARPRSLSVTDIEKWRRDPYAIYARYVLGLKARDGIDEEPGPRQRGIAVHKALETFLAKYPDALPETALPELERIGREAFAANGATPALLALWWPRFSRAARWFLDFENERRKRVRKAFVEQKGRLELQGPGGAFILSGRADRIDLLSDGSASIIDYKTGSVPSKKQIDAMLAPQLPLEAAMLMHGSFADVGQCRVSEFLHVKLAGGEPPGDARVYEGDATAMAEMALAWLKAEIARYDDDSQAYIPHAIWERVNYAGDYDHLARVREWSLAPEDEE